MQAKYKVYGLWLAALVLCVLAAALGVDHAQIYPRILAAGLYLAAAGCFLSSARIMQKHKIGVLWH